MPRPPAEPDPSECCGSGCVRCIFDLHDDALLRYRQSLAEWILRHPEAAAQTEVGRH
ncbi:MAG TPA: oxidoreductase-like domain-containing protein [Arenimonas sp.]|uniref:oxidoreductase-like domain-containing protein n=1 Tax=Arenimonas sp. TaxID=1872635 RepID=UPI002CE2D3B7|nr:oxidoreductase-like domain-containing protein [Arenimonas sp.]HMB56896.1 oxidoreductase-like domain-containing protein [Arenimonas sp.]